MKSLSRYIVFFIGVMLLFSCENEGEIKPTYNLPNINISYDTLSSNHKVPCVITIGDTLLLKGKIKQRGGSSIGYPKKSYTVKLSKKISLYGLRENKSWVFTSSYLEKSLMRNILSYDLFRSWDTNNFAPKIELIEFFHNDNYEGIYQLTEKVDRSSLRINKKAEGVIFKDCAVFSKTYIEPQTGETYYHQKYPDPKKYDATLLMDSIKEFILNSTDSVFAKEMEQEFDIQNIIDWQIMIMLSNNGDAVYKNFYLYRESKKAKFKIALWDYDSGFGRDTDNELNLVKTTSHWERNSLLDRLYNQDVNNYQERLHTRWKVLRESGKISVDDFESRVSKLALQLEPFVRRNFTRWPVTNSYYWDKYTWEQEIGVLKEFINLRIPQLDEKFNYNGR
ncbi:MAG: CotH kinase family protein [Flavobacteriales bacterium]